MSEEGPRRRFLDLLADMSPDIRRRFIEKFDSLSGEEAIAIARLARESRGQND